MTGRVVWSLAGKQPGGGPAQAPPVPQDREQLGREHNVAIALPPALLDANDHALNVEIARAEPDCFRDPQSGGIARRQDGAVHGGRDALERANHFVGTEQDREAARFLRRGDQIIERPRLLEGDFIQEAQGTDGDAERLGASFRSRVRYT